MSAKKFISSLRHNYRSTKQKNQMFLAGSGDGRFRCSYVARARRQTGLRSINIYTIALYSSDGDVT